jgi:membrane associated rhomboid family serine protease
MRESVYRKHWGSRSNGSETDHSGHLRKCSYTPPPVPTVVITQQRQHSPIIDRHEPASSPQISFRRIRRPSPLIQSRDEAPPRRGLSSDREYEQGDEELSVVPSGNLTPLSSYSPLRTFANWNQTSADSASYHLASPDGQIAIDVRLPSPKHRTKLKRWYEKQDAASATTSNLKGRPLQSHSQRIHQQGTIHLEKTDHLLYDEKLELPVDGMLFSNEDTFDQTADQTYDETYATNPKTMSTFADDHTLDSACAGRSVGHGDDLRTKQHVPFVSIIVMAVQLLILITQLAMCGVASLDVNPMIGPYPDAFSEWGGKNAYLMTEENQWWRLLTSSFLHVGVLHLLANALCVIWSVAVFEQEWGSCRWLLVFLVSSVGCTACASLGDADTIGVGSSGTLMGLYAAKLAQVMSCTCFEVHKSLDGNIHYDRMCGVLVGIAILSMLSACTYIDWSGHVGGLVTGFLVGILIFSTSIRHCCTRLLWALLGLLGVSGFLGFALYSVAVYIEPDEQIADTCEYFRNLFPEDYTCECAW